MAIRSHVATQALLAALIGLSAGTATAQERVAFVPGLDFHDGTIEVDVAGSVRPGALPGAPHGTVGLWVDNGPDGHFRNLSVRPR